MWKAWRRLSEPWCELPGWEFDLLRSLPSDLAKPLYLRAAAVADRRLLCTVRGWLVPAALIPASMSLALVWAGAAALGLGPLGRLAVEVAFHATIGAAIFHPLARLHWRLLLPHLRAALADELLLFARDEVGLTDLSGLDATTVGNATEGHR